MSLVFASHDSLPYIDAPVSAVERENAIKLIQRELPKGFEATPHPAISKVYEPKFSSLIQKDIDRHAAGLPRQGGIDMSRYEAPDEPSEDSQVASWRSALKSAYVSYSYLSDRQINLNLLDEWGKNAWLIGNSQLDSVLKDMEMELERLKNESEATNRARKAAQEESKAELLNLEETWKQGIGKMVEVQIAAEELRRTINERQRRAPG